MSKVALKYHFTFPDSRERTFELELDRDTAELTTPTAPHPPAWTELGFHQCNGCPFEKSKVAHCPAAVHLSTVIDGFTDLVSLDAGEQMCEIFTFTEAKRMLYATGFKVFESKLFSGGEPREYEPSECLIADITGDGANDIVLLAHDRVLIYPQMKKPK